MDLVGYGRLNRAYSYTVEWANVSGTLRFKIDGEWLIPGVTDMAGGIRVYPNVPWGQRKYLKPDTGEYEDAYYDYTSPMRLDMPVVAGIPLVFDYAPGLYSWIFLDKARQKIGAVVLKQIFTGAGYIIPPANAKFIRWNGYENYHIKDSTIAKFTNKVYLGFVNHITIVTDADITINANASVVYTASGKVIVRGANQGCVYVPATLLFEADSNPFQIKAELIPKERAMVVEYKFTNTSAQAHTVPAGTQITFKVLSNDSY